MPQGDETSRVECPSCGYDLAGEVATWQTSCPLESVCSECGGRVTWGLVLADAARIPTWSIERRCTPWSWNMARTLWAHVTVRGITQLCAPTDRMRWGRVSAYLIFLLLALYLSLTWFQIMTARELVFSWAALAWVSKMSFVSFYIPFLLIVPMCLSLPWIVAMLVRSRQHAARAIVFGTTSVIASTLLTTLAANLIVTLGRMPAEIMPSLWSGTGPFELAVGVGVCWAVGTLFCNYLVHARGWCAVWSVQRVRRGISVLPGFVSTAYYLLLIAAHFGTVAAVVLWTVRSGA